MDPHNSENLTIYGKSPVSWLIEICTKENCVPIFETFDRKTSPTAPHCFEVKIRLRNFRGGSFECSESSRNKKDAKHRASILMLNALKITKSDLYRMSSLKSRDTTVNQSFSNEDSASASNIVAISGELNSDQAPQTTWNSTISNPRDKGVETHGMDSRINHIGELQKFCIESGIEEPSFEESGSSGPSHAPRFTITCIIEDRAFTEPFFIKKTMASNKKTIKQCLAYEMLEMLRSNAAMLIEKMASAAAAANLEEEENGVINELAKKFQPKLGPTSEHCTSRKCAEMFAHTHHELQKKLSGETVTALKELINSNQLTKENSIKCLKGVCEEQVSRGLKVSTFYRTFASNLLEYHCFLEFTFQSKVYVRYGYGDTKQNAEEAAAKSMLEFLGEMSLN